MRNPNLDMTTQKGFILVHQEIGKREVVCNWCARERYYSMGPQWARINDDLDESLNIVCDYCGNSLGEGPAIFGDWSTVQEEPMKERKKPLGYTGAGLAICHECLEQKPEYKKVVSDWSVIMPGQDLPERPSCMFCKKEI